MDVTFAAGRTMALVGPSGCVKSTLLCLVTGLDAPTRGSVRIGSKTTDTLRHRAGLAVAFHSASLLPWRILRGNVAQASTLARRTADPACVDDLTRRVGLAGFEARRPVDLSGGMWRRAALARCLLAKPELLLLVTHSVTEAVTLADRVLVLSHRPATILADITIPLARPRSDGDPAFTDLVYSVNAALEASGFDRKLAAKCLRAQPPRPSRCPGADWALRPSLSHGKGSRALTPAATSS